MAYQIGTTTIVDNSRNLHNVTLGTGNSGFGSPFMTTDVYTSPATWTKPAGLTGVKVIVVGAGGGGGGTIGVPAPTGEPIKGAGGGAGGTSIRWIPAPSIPGPVSVTVGTGGALGVTPTFDGTAGGTSSFGAFASATGGGGGFNSPTGGAGGSGGAGSAGDINMNGQAGEPSILNQGFAGDSFFGSGGSISRAAVGYGSGGGGSHPVGTGAGGIVIVEEYF